MHGSHLNGLTLISQSFSHDEQVLISPGYHQDITRISPRFLDRLHHLHYMVRPWSCRTLRPLPLPNSHPRRPKSEPTLKNNSIDGQRMLKVCNFFCSVTFARTCSGPLRLSSTFDSLNLLCGLFVVRLKATRHNLSEDHVALSAKVGPAHVKHRMVSNVAFIEHSFYFIFHIMKVMKQRHCAGVVSISDPPGFTAHFTRPCKSSLAFFTSSSTYG